MTNKHKTYDEMHKEIEEAKKHINIDGIYSHYKHEDSRYKLSGFIFTEANDELCIIYSALKDESIKFARPVASWLEKVEFNGKTVDRFNQIKE